MHGARRRPGARPWPAGLVVLALALLVQLHAQLLAAWLGPLHAHDTRAARSEPASASLWAQVSTWLPAAAGRAPLFRHRSAHPAHAAHAAHPARNAPSATAPPPAGEHRDPVHAGLARHHHAVGDAPWWSLDRAADEAPAAAADGPGTGPAGAALALALLPRATAWAGVPGVGLRPEGAAERWRDAHRRRPHRPPRA